MDESSSFGYLVRRRRKTLDLTQAELARRVGCAEVTIQKIEADERRPSSQIAALLADHLRIADEERASFLRRARGARADESPPAAGDPPAQPAAPRHNLPTLLTSFVGRERELSTIARLTGETRLLTLAGPGGTGKTRLTLQAAAAVLEQFRDGAWLVELAPVADPALVAQAIASALGVREEPGRALQSTLAAWLSDKQLLLVLDSCEHLIDACAQLAEELLRACPELRLLASSREPLGCGGETIFRVPTLAVPDTREPAPPDQLARYEAVRLFVERAQAVQPGFRLAEANAAAIDQICRRLDGIPLAIELAAARLRMLPVSQIAARLDDRFRLLTGGARTALPRHQTLQALIDWSYDLLDDAERALLRRLAVFAGGCTLEAAESVCGDKETPNFLSPGLPISVPILDLLGRLIDKSLVEAEPGEPAARYRMLETIRQYALERLTASGTADEARRRHALYYLGLAETMDLNVVLTEWDRHVALLDSEVDNIRAGLAWSQTAADGAEIALRFARALEGFWTIEGYWTEGRGWLTSALAHPGGQAPTSLRAEVLRVLGSIHVYLNDYTAAGKAFSESLSIYVQLADASGRAWVLNRLGWLAREQGDTATARASLEQSLTLYRELGDLHGIVEGLNTLGEVAVMREDVDWATALLEESLSISRPRGAIYTQAWALNHLGHVAQLQGDYARATRLHEESLTLFRQAGEQYLGTAWALESLGECALGTADSATARDRLAGSLAQFRALGDRSGVAWCLAGLGTAAALDEEPVCAARLWGAAEQLRARLGCRATPAARATYERAVALARAQLGQQAFAAAWAAGAALSLDEIIAEALE